MLRIRFKTRGVLVVALAMMLFASAAAVANHDFDGDDWKGGVGDSVGNGGTLYYVYPYLKVKLAPFQREMSFDTRRADHRKKNGYADQTSGGCRSCKHGGVKVHTRPYAECHTYAKLFGYPADFTKTTYLDETRAHHEFCGQV